MISTIKNIAIHVLIWTIYLLAGIFVFGYENPRPVTYELTINIAISATVFYLHFFLLRKFFEKRLYILYTAGFLLLLLYNFGMRYFFGFIFDPHIMKRSSSVLGLSTKKVLLQFTWQLITYLACSTAYWLGLTKIDKEKEKASIQQLKAEGEKLQLENALLRSQINPHFLLNTLDSYRIESEDLQPDLSRSIMSLAELMRHIIDKSDQEYITIDDEILAIESLINIYKRRFPYMNLKYRNDIGPDSGLRLPPQVLLTFVENTFKYGSYTDKEKQMQIEMWAEDGHINFHSFNKKNSRPNKPKTEGFGNKYIRSMLTRMYQDRYCLQIDETPEDYRVQLKLPT